MSAATCTATAPAFSTTAMPALAHAREIDADHYLSAATHHLVSAVREEVTTALETHLRYIESYDHLIGVMVAVCPGNDTLVVEALYAHAHTWPVTITSMSSYPDAGSLAQVATAQLTQQL